MQGDKFITPDGTLSGSNITMMQAVHNCVNHCDIQLPEALRMASLYPAKVMGLQNNISKIEVGYTANLIILNEVLNVKEIFFQGEKVNSTFQH